MAIIPTNTAPAGISSGIGTGYAQILGGTSFDPVRFSENLLAEKQAERAAEAKRQLDLRTKNAAWVAKLPKAEYVTTFNRPVIEKLYEDAELKLAEAQASGIDLESSGEGRRVFNDLQIGLKNAENTGKEIAEVAEKYREMAAQKPELYDYEEYDKWFKGLEKLPTLDAQLQYVLSTKPFEQKISYLPIYEDLAKFVEADAIEKGITTTTALDPKKVGVMATEYFLDMALNNKGQYDAMYNSGKDNLWNTPQEMVDHFATKFVEKGAVTIAQDEPRSSGGGINVTVGGGNASNKDWAVSAMYNQNFPKAQGKANSAVLSYKGGDLRPMAFVNEVGKSVYIKPELVRTKETPQGTVWILQGKAAKRATGDQLKKQAEAVSKTITVDTYAAQQGYEKDPETGEYVSIKETETVDLPIDWTEDSIGYPNFAILRDRMGIDVREVIDSKDKPQKGGNSATPKQSGSGVSDETVNQYFK